MTRDAFLDAFAQVGTVSGAAKLAGINRGTHYEWMKDPDYEKAFGDAEQQFADRVRYEVARRAMQGVKRDVYYQGGVVGQVTEYSDRMLELLAKAKCPEFREKHEISGVGGGAVKLEVITGVPQPEKA